jgi:dihydroorotase
MNGPSSLKSSRVFLDGELRPACLHLSEGKITRIESSSAALRMPADLDMGDAWILPGMIDSQVHFREPGLEHKEDLATGSLAALAGGMTAFLEMPNTKPLTVDEATLADKVQRAKGRAWCDFGFFMGATAQNAEQMGELERLPGCCGVKIFMGSSTGSLLVPDDETLEKILSHGKRRIAVHAEDEDRLNQLKNSLPQDHPREHPRVRDPECARLAVSRVLSISEKTGRPIHVLHVNSKEEMSLFRQLPAGVLGDRVTVEVTPQHLLLEAPSCYDELGSFAQMNPPIRDAGHRTALWNALDDGVITCMGSDHAPHTREEKGRAYPACPSGMPGTETLFPLMLDQCLRGRITLAKLVELLSTQPARLYHIKGKGQIAIGMRADFTIADPSYSGKLDQNLLHSRCGWSPFHGRELEGRVEAVMLRGRIVFRDGKAIGDALGQPLTYTDC